MQSPEFQALSGGLVIAPAVLMASPWARIGHLADLGGHAHWAGLALGAARRRLLPALPLPGKGVDEDEDASLRPRIRRRPGDA